MRLVILCRCRRSASINPDGKRSFAVSVRFKNPAVAFADKGVGAYLRNDSRDEYRLRRGHSEAQTAVRPSPTFQAAVGQRVDAPSGEVAKSNTAPGRARRDPTQAAAGTLTALPTSFQRAPFLTAHSAGFVQSRGKPCRRSASRISGVTTLPSGIKIAGAEGMPMVDPPFRVGTASTAQPSPLIPSVQ